MQETGCLEIIVHRNTTALLKILSIASVVFTVLFVMAAAMFGWLFFFGAIAMGVAAYLIWLECDVDYEYDYVEKELRIAKILRKSGRKEIGAFDLNKTDILAPMRSHELDGYRNKKVQVHDYSSGDPQARDLYALFLSDGQCLHLNLTGEYAEEFLRIMKHYAPRKVFTY